MAIVKEVDGTGEISSGELAWALSLVRGSCRCGENGYRDYAQETVSRLEFIRRGRTSGLTLAQIGDILSVRDTAEKGSWSSYYDPWQSMRLDPADPIWHIELPGVEARSSIDLPTCSKWGEALAGRIPVGDEVILTGVATDCCVLATALGAADAGRYVTVVEDACAGQSDAAHEQALSLLELLSPMINVVKSDSLHI